jgi:hypothetical protein
MCGRSSSEVFLGWSTTPAGNDFAVDFGELQNYFQNLFCHPGPLGIVIFFA